jgi:hypothetical protein
MDRLNNGPIVPTVLKEDDYVQNSTTRTVPPPALVVVVSFLRLSSSFMRTLLAMLATRTNSV